MYSASLDWQTATSLLAHWSAQARVYPFSKFVLSVPDCLHEPTYHDLTHCLDIQLQALMWSVKTVSKYLPSLGCRGPLACTETKEIIPTTAYADILWLIYNSETLIPKLVTMYIYVEPDCSYKVLHYMQYSYTVLCTQASIIFSAHKQNNAHMNIHMTYHCTCVLGSATHTWP